MFKTVINKMEKYYVQICKSSRIELTPENIQTVLSPESGVYIFYEEKHPIYVGRAMNIRNRILQQHLSKRDTVSSSSFRMHLRDSGRVKEYKDIREYFLEHCALKFIKIDNYDDSLLLKALLIKLWRKKYNLLHDNKYESGT
ncbi:MAG: GIY-YIG nuclease family protein [Thermoleophilia bacterium]|nr:GIY-YIG nuclease family protein [Thermoleophilia bacterium]